MSDKIKLKIKQALENQAQRNTGKPTHFKCPLHCWDIFALIKEEFKPKKPKKTS